MRDETCFLVLTWYFLIRLPFPLKENGGERLGQRGHSKDHRPALNQVVAGVVIDRNGKPVCCEIWPGNTADVKTQIPVVERIRGRFHIGQFCLVADRGMISAETVKELNERKIPYILGARMRRVTEIKEDVLSHPGQYQEVYPEGKSSRDPIPLKVREVTVGGSRYIVCHNSRQARKDARDRQAIIASLQEKIKSGPKSLVGNKGYRKYLKIDRDSVSIDQEKIEEESRFDGTGVLTINTNFSTDQVAIKYKELWQVEQVFLDVKSVVDTRPVYHQRDENITDHVC